MTPFNIPKGGAPGSPLLVYILHRSTLQCGPLGNVNLSSTRHSPIYLNYGFHPKTELAPANAPFATVPAAASLVSAVHQARMAAKDALEIARRRMMDLYDSRSSPAPPFKVGGRVLVNAQHIDASQVSKKLTFRFIGPYTITQQTGPLNFRVDAQLDTMSSTSTAYALTSSQLHSHIARCSSVPQPRSQRPMPIS
jgi:hypothetical protein